VAEGHYAYCTNKPGVPDRISESQEQDGSQDGGYRGHEDRQGAKIGFLIYQGSGHIATEYIDKNIKKADKTKSADN
jgi:hypothetical protein